MMIDFITIYGTGKSTEMPDGKAFNEPRGMAEHLVETGFARYEAKEKVQQSYIPKAEGEPTAKKNRKGKP